MEVRDLSKRDQDLLDAYKKALDQASYPFLLCEVVEMAISMPAKQYYCAVRGVYESIREIERGQRPHFCSDERARLVADIYDKVQEIRKVKPEMHLKHIVELVIDSPAPEFYLKKSSAIVILHHIKKKERVNEHIKRISQNERMERRKNRKRPFV